MKMKDCLYYYISEEGNLVVQIIDELEVEDILDINASDLHNFYYLTDLEKEKWGFYFTTLKEIQLWDKSETPVFLEYWFQTDSWKFFFSWRVWQYKDTEYSALASLLYNKKCIFEFSDRIIDIENIEAVANQMWIKLSYEDKYTVYESIINRKFEWDLRKLNTVCFIEKVINDLRK